MRALLPSVIVVFSSACAKSPPPVPPGPPLAAASEVAVDTMAAECDALVAALARWKRCPNVEPADTAYIEWWEREIAIDFAAGAKATIEPPAQKAIAVRCHRAAASVTAATERCGNGKRPKI